MRLHAAVVIYSQTVGASIPDDTATGLFREIAVAELGVINSVEISLNVTAVSGSQAFLGDLYVYLRHESALSVLLNRPGRRPGESLGYDDNQPLAVTFQDTASANIHSYRLTLFGDERQPLSSPLTGVWQPDGRTTDPDSVLASDPSLAPLSVFGGLPSEGTWRLFAADLSSGAGHQLDSWSLKVDFTPVPEPRTWTMVAACGLLAFAWLRRARHRCSPPAKVPGV